MRAISRIAVLSTVAVAAVVLPIGAAHAALSMSSSISWPSGAAVGATNLAGSFTVQNVNSAPQQTETQRITSLRLAPSCGASRNGSTVCPSPDPGVYAVSSAQGAAATACAGITFSVSAPDASGVITLTPSTTVVLQPPGGATGSDRCTVNLVINVTKLPGIDVDVAAGSQTFTNLFVQTVTSPSNLTLATGPSVKTTVVPGSTAASAPTITKAFGASSIPFGANTILTFSITNPNSGTVLHGVGFTDTLPSGLVVATPNGLVGSCGGGTMSAVAGSRTISLSAATLPAGTSCTFSANVTAVGVGTQANTTSVVTSTEAGNGASATASLTVTRAPTTTAVGATPTTADFGSVVTFTAVVAPAQANNSGVAPTGAVSFFLDGQATPVATVAVTGGQASFATSGLGASRHTVVATYTGDTFFAGSSPAVAAAATLTCTTTITGNRGAITLGPGSTCLSAAHITGGVTVPRGSSIDVENSTISGTLKSAGPSAFRLCGSSVVGSVTVTAATGFVLIGDPGDDGCASNNIGKSLTLKNNHHGVEAIGNHVGGLITVANNSGSGAFPEDTAPDISGNGP